MSLDQSYWDKRYKDQSTGWDIGSPSPALVTYACNFPKDTSILIPGAGKGHEAIFLADKGYMNITVCDLSPTALDIILHTPKEHSIELIQGDFFDLTSQYDLILEQTFFCALDPKLRTRYVSKMYDLLSIDGILAGVLFAQKFEKEGPPFGGEADEYEKLFSEKFDILHLEPCYNSIPPRSGSELFFELRKKI